MIHAYLSQRKAILSAKSEEILNVLYEAQENFTGRVCAPPAADLQPVYDTVTFMLMGQVFCLMWIT